MLKTIDMLSDDMIWTCSGMCGKKQPMPVGMGAPQSSVGSTSVEDREGITYEDKPRDCGVYA